VAARISKRPRTSKRWTGGLAKTWVRVRSMAGAESSPTVLAAPPSRPGTTPRLRPIETSITRPGRPAGLRPTSNAPAAIAGAVGPMVESPTPRTCTTSPPPAPFGGSSSALPSTYGAASVTWSTDRASRSSESAFAIPRASVLTMRTWGSTDTSRSRTKS
jgi:hypothetical protein